MNLSIIIINYNTKDLTRACIDSLYNQYSSEFEEGKFEIILIDNASVDKSGQELEEIFKSKKGFVFIQSDENLGFGRGNNEAAKKAKGKYLLFLNSDTEVLDRGLVQMVDYMEDNSKAGILGARLENPDSTNQKSAVKFYYLPNLFLMLSGLERVGFLRSSPAKISKVDWVSGASLMIRQELFERLEGFDKNIFMYIEDMELCYRVGKAGFDVIFYPYIKIVHKERGSSNKQFAITNIYKGLLYFYKKHRKNEYLMAKFLLMSKARLLVISGKMLNNKNLEETYQKALNT